MGLCFRFKKGVTGLSSYYSPLHVVKSAVIYIGVLTMDQGPLKRASQTTQDLNVRA